MKVSHIFPMLGLALFCQCHEATAEGVPTTPQSPTETTDSATAEALKPVNGELAGLNARHDSLNAQTKDKKWDEVDQSVKDDLSATEKKIEEEKGKKTSIIAESAKDNAVVHQLIDLALLQNGMLRGESLARFVKRSIDLI